MLLMGPVLLIAIVVAIAYAATHRDAAHRLTGPGAGHLPGPQPGPVEPVDAALRRELADWVDAGLISTDQSRAILDHELHAHPVTPAPPAVTVAPEPRPRRGLPPVAEALGYLGGILALVGLGLLIGARWADLGTLARLVISGASAAVFVAGGALVDERADPALARLRWFLWLLSTAATGLFAGVLAYDAFGVEQDARVISAVALGIAVESAALWQWRERPLQQLTTIGGFAVLVGAGVTVVAGAGPAGIALWALGAAVLALGLARRTPLATLTEALGALTMAAAGGVMTGDWEALGSLTIALTGVGLLVASQVRGVLPTAQDRFVVGAIGAITAASGVPGAVAYFAKDAGVLTGLVVWAGGAAAVALARHPRTMSPLAAHVAGGVALIAGAALTGVQSQAFATTFGIATAVALVALGTRPDRGVMSVFGSLGLLVFVPWAIGFFFPGEGRAPLLIMVSGALILGVAALLARMSRRLRDELGGGNGRGQPGST